MIPSCPQHQTFPGVTLLSLRVFVSSDWLQGLDDLGMSMGAMRVHDVSKSTAGGSSPSAEGRPGIGSAGRRSAAPGAAGPSDGGGAQGSGQGGSGRGGAGSSNEPRLVFHMSGQVLQPATTIFQAILQARQAEVNRAENAGEDPPACSQRYHLDSFFTCVVCSDSSMLDTIPHLVVHVPLFSSLFNRNEMLTVSCLLQALGYCVLCDIRQVWDKR